VAIESGERVGLVGINGSGKSTLARILAGVETPDGGTVARRRGADVVYLTQEPVFDEALTAREIVMGGLRAWAEAKGRHDAASHGLASGRGDLEALLEAQTSAAADVERLGGWDRMPEVDEVLTHVGVQWTDRPVATLSGGDRRRVALARLLVAAPALAILDEPSNHLDVETIEWLERYLVEELRGALLLITHDRYLLDRVVSRTLELSRGKLYSYDGGYEAYLEAKAERAEHEARTESNRQNFLRRELEWLRRQPKARTGKQKARIDRAETAQAAPAPRAERNVRLAMDATRTGKTILELRRLGLSIGDLELVRDLEVILTPGERLGVVGRNGTGKTTLLRAIAGEVTPTKGEVVIGKNTSVAYFDQHRAALDDAASVFDNVAAGRSRVETFGESIEVRSYLERFLFEPQKQRQPVGSLSGGERARVALAKLLSRASNLVLLDEPTNDLDVATLGALEQMLVDFDGCAVVVTHDRWFLDRVATSILAFEGEGRVVRYAGNYDAYRTQRIAREAADAPAPAIAPKPERPRTAPVVPTGHRPLTYGERLELDGLLDRVEAAENEVRELERVLADPAIYATRGGEVPGLVARLEAARGEATRLTARWEDLEQRRDASRS